MSPNTPFSSPLETLQLHLADRAKSVGGGVDRDAGQQALGRSFLEFAACFMTFLARETSPHCFNA